MSASIISVISSMCACHMALVPRLNSCTTSPSFLTTKVMVSPGLTSTDDGSKAIPVMPTSITRSAFAGSPGCPIEVPCPWPPSWLPAAKAAGLATAAAMPAMAVMQGFMSVSSFSVDCRGLELSSAAGRRPWRRARHCASRWLASENTVFLLKRTHIGGNRLDVGIRHTAHRRHVAVSPVMRPDAVFRRENEGHVRMVAGLVNPVNQRRALPFVSRGVGPVAGRAFGIECALAHACLRRQNARHVHLDDGRPVREAGCVWRGHRMPLRPRPHSLPNEHSSTRSQNSHDHPSDSCHFLPAVLPLSRPVTVRTGRHRRADIRCPDDMAMLQRWKVKTYLETHFPDARRVTSRESAPPAGRSIAR